MAGRVTPGSQPDVDLRPLVLIIEDDPANRTLLERLLERDGYRTRSAGDGEAGLLAVGEHSPDLILLDIGLPRLDGLRGDPPPPVPRPHAHRADHPADRADRPGGRGGEDSTPAPTTSCRSRSASPSCWPASGAPFDFARRSSGWTPHMPRWPPSPMPSRPRTRVPSTTVSALPTSPPGSGHRPAWGRPISRPWPTVRSSTTSARSGSPSRS